MATPTPGGGTPPTPVPGPGAPTPPTPTPPTPPAPAPAGGGGTPPAPKRKPKRLKKTAVWDSREWLMNGIAATVTMILALLIILYLSNGLDWVIGIAVVLFSLVLMKQGLHLVPERNYGVPRILQKRKPGEAFEEGWTWVFPFIMTVKNVSQKHQVLTIPKEDGEPLTVNTIDSIGKSKKRLVVMKARIVVRWQATNPWYFLNVEDELQKQGQSVERTVGDLAIKSLRQCGAEVSDLEFMEKRDDWEKKVKEAIEDDMDENERVRTIDHLGVKIIGVVIPKIDYLDPDTSKAYESVTRAMKKREADNEQVLLIQNAIAELKKKFPEMNDDEASRIVLTQLGKITRTETRGDLTNVAVILKDAVEKWMARGGGTP